MDKDWKIKLNEDYDDYGYRIYKNRALYGLNNPEVGEILNKEFPPFKDESARRKDFASYIRGYDKGYEKGCKDSTVDRGIMPINSLTPKSHLDKLSELTGEYNIRKRETQLERNELAKLVREAVPSILLAEQYKEALENGAIKLPDFKFDSKYLTVGTSVIKAYLSDWHIGVEVDEEYNIYNYNVACERIDEYAQKTIEYGKLFNAHTISVTHLGDIVEGINMRNPQKWDCEFNFSEQIVKAQELMWRYVTALMEHFNVELSGVYGNHDRLVGSKHDAIENDSAMFIIMENMKNAVRFSESISGKKLERLTFVNTTDDYEFQVDDLEGKKIRSQHGHQQSKNDNNKIEKFNGTDGVSYDVIVFGHLHHGRIINRNRAEKEIYCGSLQGSNQYGKNVVDSLADASQTLVVFRDTGEVLPIEVNLQNV